MKTLLLTLVLTLSAITAKAESPVDTMPDYSSLDRTSYNVLAQTLNKIKRINSQPPKVAALLCLYKDLYSSIEAIEGIEATYFYMNLRNTDSDEVVSVPVQKVRRKGKNIKVWAQNMLPVECITIEGVRTK